MSRRADDAAAVLPLACFLCKECDWISSEAGSRRCSCDRGRALVAQGNGQASVRKAGLVGGKKSAADYGKRSAGDRD